MRIDDVRAEGARDLPGITEERGVTALSTVARVDDGALDLVAARDQLGLEVRDEDSEVRVTRARVHL
jgi:hypothetical protein